MLALALAVADAERYGLQGMIIIIIIIIADEGHFLLLLPAVSFFLILPTRSQHQLCSNQAHAGALLLLTIRIPACTQSAVTAAAI
jgi:hypothetical protein